jgi:hypothetical protein
LKPDRQHTSSSRRAPAGSPRRWLFEFKYDGYRGLCYIESGRSRFISRNGSEAPAVSGDEWENQRTLSAAAGSGGCLPHDQPASTASWHRNESRITLEADKPSRIAMTKAPFFAIACLLFADTGWAAECSRETVHGI